MDQSAGVSRFDCDDCRGNGEEAFDVLDALHQCCLFQTLGRRFSSSSVNLWVADHSLSHHVGDTKSIAEQSDTDAITFREAVAESMDEQGFPFRTHAKDEASDRHTIRDSDVFAPYNDCHCRPTKMLDGQLKSMRWLPQFYG